MTHPFDEALEHHKKRQSPNIVPFGRHAEEHYRHGWNDCLRAVLAIANEKELGTGVRDAIKQLCVEVKT